MKRIFNVLGKFIEKSTDDSLQAYAAQATFFILLSFFPFAMLLVMIASRFSLENEGVLTQILNLVPGQLDSYIAYIVDDITYSNSNSFTVITLIVSLWSAAKGIQSLTYGLDRIYKVRVKKNYFISRLICSLYTFILLLMCLVIIVVHIFGKAIAKRIIENNPDWENTTLLILSLKSAFTFVIIFVCLLLIYYHLPGRKGRVKHEVIGAASAALMWMLMTKGFTYYIRHSSSASYVYGSLTSIILIIIWLYICMQIVFYGAQINYFIKEKMESKNNVTQEVDMK